MLTITNYTENEIKNFNLLIAGYTKKYKELLAEFNALYNLTYENNTPENLDKIAECFTKTDMLYKLIGTSGIKFQANKIFCNDYILLCLKVEVLIAKTSSLIANGFEDQRKTYERYRDIILKFMTYQERLEYYADENFHHSMHECFNYMFNNEKLLHKFGAVNVDIYINALRCLIHIFASKLPDCLLKLHYSYPYEMGQINYNDSIRQHKKNGVIIGNFKNIFMNIKNHYEQLPVKDPISSVNYLSALHCMFMFASKSNYQLRSMDIKNTLSSKNVVEAEKYFSMHSQLIDEYLSPLVELLPSFNLENFNIDYILSIRLIGFQLLQFIKEYIAHLRTWETQLQSNQLSNKNCNKYLLQIYELTLEVASFYITFFKRYPERNHGYISPSVKIIDEKYDFKRSMKSEEMLNNIISRLRDTEAVRVAEYAKIMQSLLNISEKTCEFLTDLETMKRAASQKRREAREEARRKSIIPKKNNNNKKTNNNHAIVKFNSPDVATIPDISSPLLDEASDLMESHKNEAAATLYQLAYAKAMSGNDIPLALSALDGLTTIHSRLLAKHIAKIDVILHARLKIDNPLPREMRISLNASMQFVEYTLDLLHILSDNLFKLSATKNLKVNAATEYGINFSKELLIHAINHFVQITKENNVLYLKVKTKTIQDREAFILQLGRQVAGDTHSLLTHEQLMDLGKKQFEQIGKDKSDQGIPDSDHTHERTLLQKLDMKFNHAAKVSEHIQRNLTAKKPSPLPKIKEQAQVTNLFAKSSIIVDMPAELKASLQRFSQPCCLHGDIVHDLVLMQGINPGSLARYVMQGTQKQCPRDINAAAIDLINPDSGQDIFSYMLNQPFTIMTLFCVPYNDTQVIIHDLTGRALHDLDQMNLAMTHGTPENAFAINPELILIALYFISHGFMPELKIIKAMQQLPPLTESQQQTLDTAAYYQLLNMNHGERIKHVKLLLQYGLLEKLFSIEHEGNTTNTLQKLEKYLGLTSLALMNNPALTFAPSARKIENNNSLTTIGLSM